MPILAEMNDASDRTVAIVSAAFVDNNLALAIMARFRHLSIAEQKHIFENRGVLSDFAGKIDLGYVLGIYESLVRDDLDNIRRIRNKFAHDLEVRAFDHAEVAALCEKLHAPKRLDTAAAPTPAKQRTRREMYSDTVDHLVTRFSLESKAPVLPPSGRHRVTADY